MSLVLHDLVVTTAGGIATPIVAAKLLCLLAMAGWVRTRGRDTAPKANPRSTLQSTSSCAGSGILLCLDGSRFAAVGGRRFWQKAGCEASGEVARCSQTPLTAPGGGPRLYTGLLYLVFASAWHKEWGCE